MDGNLNLARVATNENVYRFYDLASNPAATFETVGCLEPPHPGLPRLPPRRRRRVPKAPLLWPQWLERQETIDGTLCYIRVSNVLTYSHCMPSWYNTPYVSGYETDFVSQYSLSVAADNTVTRSGATGGETL